MKEMMNWRNRRVQGVILVRQGIMMQKASSRNRKKAFMIGPFLPPAIMVLLPLQDHLPSVAGFSILYMFFGVVAVYVVVQRLHALVRVSKHPVFIASYALLAVCFVIESLHSNSDYSELIRYGAMITGALLLASICNCEGAVRVSMYGYVIASLWLSVFLISTSYGALEAASVSGFQEASRIRQEVFTGNSLQANLNTMAFISSQGVFVALAMMLTSQSRIRRMLFLASALFCLIASFVPMSRSGIVIAIVSAVVVLFKYKRKRLQAIGAALVLGVGILIWVPDTVFSRLQYSTARQDGKMEARARIYTAAWKDVPEYIGFGVGTGNFFKDWAKDHGLVSSSGNVAGAHNGFFQVTIYWGLPAFLALIFLISQVYRSLPKNIDDATALFLYGLAVSLLLWMMATHNIYGKEFSLGLGLIAGSQESRRRSIAFVRYATIFGRETPAQAVQKKMIGSATT